MVATQVGRSRGGAFQRGDVVGEVFQGAEELRREEINRFSIILGQFHTKTGRHPP